MRFGREHRAYYTTKTGQSSTGTYPEPPDSINLWGGMSRIEEVSLV